MQLITSKENRIIKDAAALREKKYRDRSGMFLLEGPNIVREAMTEGGRVRFIFTRAGVFSEEIEKIVSDAEEKGTAVYELTDDVFFKLCDTENSQGIIAAANKKVFSEEGFFRDAGRGNLLVLDRIQDPGNAGTMIRTAEAMGFKGLISIKGSADVYGPKVVRAAAGSVLRLPVLECESGEAALQLLKANGKKIYAAAMNAVLSVFEADLKEDAAVIIGNEGGGVSQILLENAQTLSIPMIGNTESLNAALAGAMIMYESLRQRLA